MEGDEKKKVFMVDDDEIHLVTAELILKGEYEIYKMKSGSEALKYLLDNKFVPDIILLDLVMPNMDGWETYSRIRAISGLHDTPIAFFTASKDPKDIQHAQEMGAVDYIKKPTSKDELLERITKNLSRVVKT